MPSPVRLKPTGYDDMLKQIDDSMKRFEVALRQDAATNKLFSKEQHGFLGALYNNISDLSDCVRLLASAVRDD